MTNNHRNVSIRGRTFRVRAGDVLLDGALANGVDIPHDCRAGTCGTCMVQVVKGQTVCGETHTQGMVHACQARVVSDLEVEMEDVPEIDTTWARLIGLRELAPDILELAIVPEKSITYLPGQYFRFTFNGFPARAYSPTASLDGRIGGNVIRLNVKRVRGGRVSSSLGAAIRPGHRLRIHGPFGRAFLRAGGTGRLILAGSGTGFAPIWAIACMALLENSSRPIVMIAGARRFSALYMRAVLEKLALRPNVTVIPTIEEGPSPHPSVRVGRIEAHIPPLNDSDIVYACGSPRMVNAVAGCVDSAGATFYADPFESAGPEEPTGLLGMLKTFMQARRNPELSGEDKGGRRRPEPYSSRPAKEPDNSAKVVHPRNSHRQPAEQQDKARGVMLEQSSTLPKHNRVAEEGRISGSVPGTKIEQETRETEANKLPVV